MKFRELKLCESHIEKWMVDFIKDYFLNGDIMGDYVDFYFTDEDGDFSEELRKMERAGIIYLDDDTWHVEENAIESNSVLKKLNDKFLGI